MTVENADKTRGVRNAAATVAIENMCLSNEFVDGAELPLVREKN